MHEIKINNKVVCKYEFGIVQSVIRVVRINCIDPNQVKNFVDLIDKCHPEERIQGYAFLDVEL